MTAIDEIAPDLFRLSVYVPDFDMQFNHFLVRDKEPMLFHAGLKSMFPSLREAMAKVMDLRSSGISPGATFSLTNAACLNEWLRLAP